MFQGDSDWGGKVAGKALLLKLSVGGAIGVVEVWASVGIVGRTADAWLDTGGRPPPGGILWQFTHLHTAALSMGLGTTAVAGSGGNAAEAGASVCEQAGGAGRDEQQQDESLAKDARHAHERGKGPGHEESVEPVERKNP